jgi:hypothetical protein
MGRRSATIRTLGDLAQRPALPDVAAEQATSGSWAVAVVETTHVHIGPLLDLLACSLPPRDRAARCPVDPSGYAFFARDRRPSAHELWSRMERAKAAAAKRKSTP